MTTAKKPGLYANIHAKQERIAHGSGEKMRKPGAEGAPSASDFREAEKTAGTAHKSKTTASSKSSKRKSSK